MTHKIFSYLACAAVALSASVMTLPAAETPSDGQPPRERGEKKRPDGKGGRECGEKKHFRKDGPGRHMWKDLNLTDDQKAQIKAVMESKKPLLDAIRKEHMEKMKYVMDEAQKEIRPILTPEQQQVLDDMKKLREDKARLRDQKDAEPTP